MASGVSVADECIEAYKEVKLGHKHRYVIFSLNPGQDTIIVEQKLAKVEENAMATPGEKYSHFLQVLATKKSKGECCYAVYDAEYKRSNGQQRSKIIFIVWYVKMAIFFLIQHRDYIEKSSGVGVHPDCVKAFTDIKLGHKYRYVIYALSDDLKEICVKSVSPPSSNWDEFVQELVDAAAQKQCRYGVYDAEYVLGSGQQRSKLVFVVWNPDTSPIKQKMIYSSSKDALKKAINFVAKDFQANDQEDLAWSNLLESVTRHEVAD